MDNSDTVLGESFYNGVLAAESALAGREEPLFNEMKEYFDLWVSGLNTEPTDEMVAAWLVGFSKTLNNNFNLLAITAKEPPVIN